MTFFCCNNIPTFAPTFTDTMTRRKHLHILLFLLAAFFTACKPPIDPKAQLHKAERNIETNPEAALASLDSILNPDLSLSHADHMKYALLHAEAAYLSFKEVKNDTTIFEACRYYEKKQDLPQFTKAALYSACVLEAQGQTDAAVDAYNKAFALASQNADSAMMAKAKHYLGNMNYNTGYYDEAVKNFKQADKYYADNLSKKAQMLRAIGAAFTLKYENDSAVHYLEKGLELARDAENEMEESYILNTMSIIYREKGDYEESLLLLRQSASVGVAENDSIRLHLNYADLFLGMDELDSTKFYAGKLQKEVKDVEDGSERAAIYNLLAKFEASIENMDSAYYFQQQNINAVSDEYHKRLQQSLYEAQLKYDFEAQQNQYYQQLAQRRKTIIVLVFALLLLAVFLSVLLLINLHRKKEMIQLKDDFLSFKQQTIELQNELDSQKKQQTGQTDLQQKTLDLLNIANTYKEESLKKQFRLLCNMEVYRLNTGDKALLETLCSSMYGKSDFWTAALKVADEIYPNVVKNIRKKCPGLTDEEFKTAVFLLMGVPRQTEAILLKNSVNMVDKNRVKVRKMLKNHGIDC